MTGGAGADARGGISGTTQVIALLGSPVSHSRSPAMQNAVFRAMRLDFVYIAFDVGLDRAAAAVDALRTLGVRGANVTMPLKRAVVPLLDGLSPAAELAEAVNVIVNDAGRLTGHVTDGEGFALSLAEEGVTMAGRRVALLGAGGAATAVAVQAAMDGARAIDLFNRRDAFFEQGVATADRLRRRFGCEARMHDLADAGALAAALAEGDILINGTSVGMDETGGGMALSDPGLLHPGLVVCDLIYSPPQTPLLRAAADRGCRTVSGLGMQLYQAVPAFRLWTGQEMDLDVARRALYG